MASKIKSDRFWILISTVVSMLVLSLGGYLFLDRLYGPLVTFSPLMFYILSLETKLGSRLLITLLMLYTLVIVIA